MKLLFVLSIPHIASSFLPKARFHLIFATSFFAGHCYSRRACGKKNSSLVTGGDRYPAWLEK
jgi:hypothetical protein